MKMIHKFLATYYFILIQDCIYEKVKEHLLQKLIYHKSKLNP
ncbi:hypothetical protein [Rossellomorea vietnamensis]|nr:hypothetical protein Q7C14_17100 [Rossellomorea vietnamensis]WQI94734.1 hypothetical protein Q7C14_17110 [Rossellomorea vietnamensis]